MPVAAEIGFESGHDDHVADTGLDPQVASGAHVGLVRLVRLDRVDRFVVEDHPKNPHATTARVSSTKTTTSAMSVADRFWFRNGLNPMSDNVAHFLASLARSVGEARASRRMAGAERRGGLGALIGQMRPRSVPSLRTSISSSASLPPVARTGVMMGMCSETWWTLVAEGVAWESGL